MYARTHNLPLTGIYKGIFAQVLAYAWFYKSEKIHEYAQSSFYACVHFTMKSTESFMNETPGYFRQFRNPVQQNMSPGSGSSGHLILLYSLKEDTFVNNLPIVHGWFHRQFFVPGAAYVLLISRSVFIISSSISSL